MARRTLPEINAGSMADIAFLLLIFWLVTTTIDSDEGIKRQLPPPITDEIDPPPVRERNVFVVLVNANDDLLVEGDELKIGRLKQKAKDFLIANGDGLLYGDRPQDPDLPVRERISKSFVKQKVAEYTAYVTGAEDETEKDNFQKVLDNWRKKLRSIELLGGEFKMLPGSAIISMRNDNNTTYDAYLQVQNELEAAVNELRDELAVAKFGNTYKQLEDEYELNSENEELLDRIYAIRLVYPQRISEAEPSAAAN
jgi:biopolymer transport protein ExbD